MSVTSDQKLSALESAFGLIKAIVGKKLDLADLESLASTAGTIVSGVTSVVHAVEGLLNHTADTVTLDQVKANLAALQKIKDTNAAIDAAADAKFGPPPVGAGG